MSREIVAEFDQALAIMPASDWVKELEAQPTGAVVQDRKIMSTKKTPTLYYDVTLGRYLTEKELSDAGLKQ